MLWVLGVVALAFGIWLGLPGDRRASERETLEAFERGGGRRTGTKRAVVWLDYLFRGKKKSRVRERNQRSAFGNLVSGQNPPEKKGSGSQERE